MEFVEKPTLNKMYHKNNNLKKKRVLKKKKTVASLFAISSTSS